MKKPVTKFKAQVPEYAGGGFFGKDGLGSTPGIGMAAGASGKLLNQISPNIMDPNLMDKQYETDFAKASQPGKIAGGIADAAISSGNPYAMVAGLGVKGVMAVGRAAGIGQGKFEKAESNAEKRKFNRDVDAVTTAGARNINSLEEYSSPAYGRRGLKLRKGPALRMGMGNYNTKFGKSC